MLLLQVRELQMIDKEVAILTLLLLFMWLFEEVFSLREPGVEVLKIVSDGATDDLVCIGGAPVVAVQLWKELVNHILVDRLISEELILGET